MPLTTWYLQRLLFYPSVLSVIIILSSSISEVREIFKNDRWVEEHEQSKISVRGVDGHTCGLVLLQPAMIWLLCHMMAVMWWRPSLCEPQPHQSPNTSDGPHWCDVQTSAAVRQDVGEALDVIPARLVAYLLVFLDLSNFCKKSSLIMTDNNDENQVVKNEHNPLMWVWSDGAEHLRVRWLNRV